jgi:hypothetical protein
MDRHADGFLARWARRKALVRAGAAARAEPATEPANEPAPPGSVAPTMAPGSVATPGAEAAEVAPLTTPSVPDVPAAPSPPVAAPLPTMDDVAQLSRDSDFSRFVARGVDEGVQRAALKKLFSDPRFNVMDGLDTYIDDYGKPDPIPPSMLRQMTQAAFLGLFDDDEADPKRPADGADAAPPTALAATTQDPADDDPDLRLQQDDGARRPGAGEGAGS